jgi:hypothetical protein
VVGVVVVPPGEDPPVWASAVAPPDAIAATAMARVAKPRLVALGTAFRASCRLLDWFISRLACGVS